MVKTSMKQLIVKEYRDWDSIVRKLATKLQNNVDKAKTEVDKLINNNDAVPKSVDVVTNNTNVTEGSTTA